MVDTVQGDILMYFVLDSEDPAAAVPASSSSGVIAGTDKLARDFKPGRYFEAENFSFTIALDDDEGGDDDDDDEYTGKKRKKTPQESRSYGRWRALTADIKPNPPYQAKPGDVTVTRIIDASSPVLAQHCLHSDIFKRVVLVKRARVGSTGLLSGILRMEFSMVQIRSVEWQDADAVRETCKFRFEKLAMTYIKRKLDGSTASQWPAAWDSKKNG
jgi:type VI protein secretion system component Hcp